MSTIIQAMRSVLEEVLAPALRSIDERLKALDNSRPAKLVLVATVF